MTRTWRHAVLAAFVVGTVVFVGAVSAAQVKTINITQKEFSLTPKSVTVSAGPARFVLTNAGTIEHDLMIDALRVNSGMVKPGATVTVPAAGKSPLVLKRGTYQGYCMVAGHKELGMVVTIVVK